MLRYQGQELRAVLLDLDDTLLDARTGLRTAWQAVAECALARRPGLARERVLAEIASATRWFWSDPERLHWGRVDLPRARERIVGRAFASLGLEDAELVAEVARLYTKIRERHVALIPGAVAVLERLRAAEARLALVTNGAAEVQRAKIERFGLESRFDAILIEGEFGIGKPDPRVFAHVLETLGAEPAEALMVGDDYAADVVGALAAGLHAVWIDPTGSREPPLESPRDHARLRSVSELPALLGV